MEVEYPAQERNERGVKRSWLEINEDGKNMLLQDDVTSRKYSYKAAQG